FVMDHFVPARSTEAAETVKKLRAFAREQSLVWYDVGQAGICHALLPEAGLVVPGDVVLGGDSHTTTYGALGAFSTGVGSTDIAMAMASGKTWMLVPPTIRLNFEGSLPEWVGGKDLILHAISRLGVDGATYKAIEFGGQAIGELDMDGRLTMANMAIEAGAKAGLFEVDQKTLAYVKPRAKRRFKAYEPDPEAAYEQVIDFDISDLEPQVALPHSPGNVKPISRIGEIKIDQAVIGSCTNGRLNDLRAAARVLKGNKVAPWLRCIIVPGTQETYLEALQEGLIETFVKAGAVVSPPTCGPCPGGHMGAVAAGERCLSSTNRNFIGRMGSPQAEVYLAGPAVVAAGAVTGKISHPAEVASK
ncbi:MAG: 3-isopropylmalate dehydratase large subunit, partial [Deltaproteobacteria bacterium]|nr:3-isopropylmalate dehydratase large subunit [Deltaproteobacteria bacterium]